MKAIKIEDPEMQNLVNKEKLEVLRPELETKPRVYYKNFHRYSKCFVGGSIVAVTDGKKDCVSGARIELRRGADTVDVQISDTFGDFKFDFIEPGSGVFVLAVFHENHGRAQVDVDVAMESIYIGDLMLT